jgi:CoA-dependent NAD(P)H sulfur oxidoreductase
MERQGKRLLIIGGGAAGMSAASAARRLRSDIEIVVLERGQHVSFVLCGLPYFIADVVKSPDDLILHTPESFRAERDVDVRTGCEVKYINAREREVELVDVATRVRSVISYDKLIIAAGAQPIVPQIRGLGLAGVFALRSIESGAAIKDFVARKPVRNASIIGAGYIGLEMAESLRRVGAQVTMIEAGDSVLPNSEPEIAEMIERELKRNSIELRKQQLALSFEAGVGGSVEKVTTDGGDVPADMVLIAAGARPDAAIARETGIVIGELGGIVTDEMMQTNIPDVYAAGDCVETRGVITGRPIFLPLGTTANKQGHVAGENACGGHAVFPGILGSLSFRVFDLEVARTGFSEDQARAAGFDPMSAVVQFPSRSSFYPGGEMLTLKLVADRQSRRLLGGQMAGNESVAKRVDTIATAIHAKMTVSDLIYLDLAYSPPFGPVWDGIQLAAQELLQS